MKYKTKNKKSDINLKQSYKEIIKPRKSLCNLTIVLQNESNLKFKSGERREPKRRTKRQNEQFPDDEKSHDAM